MILGMARNVGLTWTPAGFKVRCSVFRVSLTESSDLQLFHYDTCIPGPPYIRLTISHLEIFGFFGLARDIHERGFSTTQEVFNWVATSRFFNPHRLLPAVRGLKFKDGRKMHNEFLDYLDSLIASAESKKQLDVHAVQDEAPTSSGKKKGVDGSWVLGGCEDFYRRDEGSGSRWSRRQEWGLEGGDDQAERGREESIGVRVEGGDDLTQTR
jgi:hypothetical protein